MRVGSARDGASGHAPAEARPRVVPAVARAAAGHRHPLAWLSRPAYAPRCAERPSARRTPGMGKAPGVASVATPGASPKRVLPMAEHPIVAPLSNRMGAAHCRPNASCLVPTHTYTPCGRTRPRFFLRTSQWNRADIRRGGGTDGHVRRRTRDGARATRAGMRVRNEGPRGGPRRVTRRHAPHLVG